MPDAQGCSMGAQFVVWDSARVWCGMTGLSIVCAESLNTTAIRVLRRVEQHLLNTVRGCGACLSTIPLIRLIMHISPPGLV